jgi:hypothetical protein
MSSPSTNTGLNVVIDHFSMTLHAPSVDEIWQRRMGKPAACRRFTRGESTFTLYTGHLVRESIVGRTLFVLLLKDSAIAVAL